MYKVENTTGKHISVKYTTNKFIKKIVGDTVNHDYCVIFYSIMTPQIDTLPIVAMWHTMILFALIHIR